MMTTPAQWTSSKRSDTVDYEQGRGLKRVASAITRCYKRWLVFALCTWSGFDFASDITLGLSCFIGGAAQGIPVHYSTSNRSRLAPTSPHDTKYHSVHSMVVAATGCFSPAQAHAHTDEWLHCFNYPVPRQVSLLRHLELAGHNDSLDCCSGLRFPRTGNARVGGTCKPGRLLLFGPVLPSSQVRWQGAVMSERVARGSPIFDPRLPPARLTLRHLWCH